LFVILSLCSIATNASVLNFNGFGSTGTVSYSQDAGPNQGLLVGANIDIALISGSEGTAQDGLFYDCVECKLNFVSGSFDFVSSVIANPITGNTYVFDAGGSFEIIGNMDMDLGVGIDLMFNSATSLLLGTWTSQITVNAVGNSMSISNLFGTDTKNQTLLDFFGITESNFTFANANIQIGGTAPGGLNPFNTDVLNSSIANTASPVPLPAAVWMMGAGLIALVGVGRRSK